MLPPKSVVSPRTTSGDLKPGGGVNRWMKLYKGSVHGSTPTRPERRETRRLKPKRQSRPTLMPSAWQSMLSGWQSLRQRKRNLLKYPEGVMVFSALPNRWTTKKQDIIGENCVCNDASVLVLNDEDKMKAWVEHYAGPLNIEFQ